MTENRKTYPPIYPTGEQNEHIRNNWYSVAKVAQLFGYTPATIYGYVRKGFMPVAILDSDSDSSSPSLTKYRIDPDHVHALLDERDKMAAWYSVSDVSRILSISATSVYQMLWDGRLRGQKINDDHQWRIDNEQVDAAARRIAEKEIAVRKAVLEAL